MLEPRMVLLGRKECHLCEVARQVVVRVATELGVPWAEHDVDADPALARKYGELVPVVLIDGEQHAHWRVDEERLRAALHTAGRRST